GERKYARSDCSIGDSKPMVHRHDPPDGDRPDSFRRPWPTATPPGAQETDSEDGLPEPAILR
ncbi:hypothetical protein K7A41_01915, partial [Sphingobacterium sp. InxBP1]|uniref:hypothetical protein n=1 Tax=Sphingobacterium sp. InxBP1 TaxID=2870328 RepID=UPI002242FFC9